jgi:adenylate cyclase
MLWSPPLVGLIDTINADTREVPLSVRTAGRTYRHMAVEMARLFWRIPAENVSERDGILFLTRAEQTMPVAAIPLKRGRDLAVNWFSRWNSGRDKHVSFSDTLMYVQMLGSKVEAEAEAAENFFAQLSGAVVLIGPVDPLLQDLAPTPLDPVPVPRVGVHGNLLKTIVTQRYLKQTPPWAEYTLTVVLALGVCALAVAGGARSVRNKFLAMVILAGYTGAAFLLFGGLDVVVPLALPIGAAFTTSFAAIGWQLIVEEKQKGRIKGMFGTYVSPELVNRMVESGDDPKLGGAEAEITAYFSDIQDFSALAELLPPAQLVELMNEYLTACTDIITAEGGTLDKYIGDAVVAMFGAPVSLPDHAYRACVASQLIQQRLTALRGKWMEEGNRWPALVTQMHTRIGLNSGAAVVGNMGSLTRFNYTMMGDNVNLAARLESAARNYGVSTLVTEMTKVAAEKAGDRCVFRVLDKIVVKGRSRPVSIYELVGLKETLAARTRDCVEIFNRGIEFYLRQDWTSAADCFSRSATLEPARPASAGSIDASTVFLKRCAAMRLNPPGKDWDGVLVLKSK